MRRAVLWTACTPLSGGVQLRRKGRRLPPVVPLDEAQVQHLEEEATQRGFMRRDTPDAKVYMEEKLSQSELIGGGVPVSNLPPVEQEKTPFDLYQRSTRDFTSQVTPYGTTGVGLGAGFGAREDKRLGFLRPRKLQPFGRESSIVPKYDENGMPIDETLTKEQLLKKRLAYMKSFEGTTMSHREHFLLVDLDFEKDAMLFGTTRGEFERNVTRLKEVINTYSKWERTDNFYYYGTIALKALTVWVLMECVQQYYELQLLEGYYDDFVEAMEGARRELQANLHCDMQRAREELQSHQPDFRPVMEAIRREKRRLLDTEEAHSTKGEKTQIPTNRGVKVNHAHAKGDVTTHIEDTFDSYVADAIKHQEQGKTLGEEGTLVTPEVSTSHGSAQCHHPMDTTREQAYVASLQQRERQQEMRRLQETSVGKKTSYSVIGALWRNIRGGDVMMMPLQQDDFVRFSYAASPTSIDTMRAIRRILLPRTEDYIQVVREEMLEYRRRREAALSHPE